MKLCTSAESLIVVLETLGVEYDENLIKKTLQVAEIFKKENKKPKTIDFTDMIYLAVTDDRVTFKTPSVTFIDECQDLNEAQHAMLSKIVKNSRFVAVGDKNQSIYGFSGADTDSYDRFLQRENTVELPLSVCYRCPKEIVKWANEVYDIMEPFEGAEDGEVIFDGDYLEAEEGDMVICRNTAPLVKAFFNFLRFEKKSYIKGKDIGESLINLVQKTEGRTSSELMDELKYKLELLEEELRGIGIEKPETHPRYLSLQERIVIIEMVCQRFYTKREVENSINEIFSNEKDGIVLSTIHKSKGLEAGTVYFLDKELLPSKFATTEEQLAQERNLDYVARTRAKKKLIYCNSY